MRHIRPWRGLARQLGLVRLLVVAVVVCAGLAPREASAATDLTIGGTAIAGAGDGDDIRLRAGPGLDGAILALVPDGTEVDVLDGPFEADDGSLWYEVAAFGQSGYMISDYLSNGGFAAAGELATVLTDLNLRAGPSTDETILTVLPPGASVAVTGETEDGFARVVYGDLVGWAYTAFLSGGGLPAPSGEAVATDFVNLRAEPSLGAAVLAVIPVGASVALTGGASNGFLSVNFDGNDGWASADYLDAGGGTPSAPSGEALTTSALNLRSGPGTSFAVLTVMPFAAAVVATGAPEAGFYPVRYGDLIGWAAADYLDFDGSVTSRIAWPFGDGAEWYILQGYNGSSHYNANSTYQYHYSFDLARRDGNTAGEPVYAPATGTIRWIDPASGGMSIDLGDGYAVAFFHVTLASGLRDGQRITQGDYVGYVSGPGGQGFAVVPHVHLTVWQTFDGGNWSRIAVPFTGINAIEGRDFPDVGGRNQYQGTSVS